MMKMTTVTQAAEAFDALQEFVRTITIAVRNDLIDVIEGTDSFSTYGIDFALDLPVLFITRFEQDGGILTVNLDLGDDEYVQYSLRVEDVTFFLDGDKY